MNELIKVTTNDNDEQLVSARELYKFLSIKKRFSAWWEQYSNMFILDQDYTGVPGGTPVHGGNGNIQFLTDYALKLDTAKHISMLTKTEKGYEARSYFIQVEKLWNDPEMVTLRALQYQQKKIKRLEDENSELQPKALFADAISGSKDSILIGDLAKLISQNEVEIGQNRLFKWLRENNYLISRRGDSYNMPTQKSIDLKIMEIKERTVIDGSGENRITRTPKITGKGQQYFINKFTGPVTMIL